MRKPTKQGLTTDNARLSGENSILHTALHYFAAGEAADHTETVKGEDPGERYVLKLWGAARADGGIVTVTFHCKGQRPSTAAYLLDAYADSWRGNYLESTAALRYATERLVAARNRIAGYNQTGYALLDNPKATVAP